ncbi:MAG: DUF1330 domain-containing protein [bacterium]|nr:DUF1330 domain-containing protein [bacterium]
MRIENRLHPDDAQIAALKEPGYEGPIAMLNLLKFRERAAYPDGRDAELSGREAFQRYGMAFAPLLEAAGGRLIYGGRVSLLALGAAEELWDAVVVVAYPSRPAFFRLTQSPEYQAAAVHRDAGLAGQLLVETVGFGAHPAAG